MENKMTPDAYIIPVDIFSKTYKLTFQDYINCLKEDMADFHRPKEEEVVNKLVLHDGE